MSISIGSNSLRYGSLGYGTLGYGYSPYGYGYSSGLNPYGYDRYRSSSLYYAAPLTTRVYAATPRTYNVPTSPTLRANPYSSGYAQTQTYQDVLRAQQDIYQAQQATEAYAAQPRANELYSGTIPPDAVARQSVQQSAGKVVQGDPADPATELTPGMVLPDGSRIVSVSPLDAAQPAADSAESPQPTIADEPTAAAKAAVGSGQSILQSAESLPVPEGLPAPEGLPVPDTALDNAVSSQNGGDEI